MDNIMFLVFAMAAVTYIPRLIPFLLLTNKQVPKRVDAFLKCIPVAAIGALIIPSVFNATPDMPVAGIIGIIFIESIVTSLTLGVILSQQLFLFHKLKTFLMLNCQ